MRSSSNSSAAEKINAERLTQRFCAKLAETMNADGSPVDEEYVPYYLAYELDGSADELHFYWDDVYLMGDNSDEDDDAPNWRLRIQENSGPEEIEGLRYMIDDQLKTAPPRSTSFSYVMENFIAGLQRVCDRKSVTLVAEREEDAAPLVVQQ